MIFHAPHAGTFIPEEYRSLFVISDSELDAEIMRMTDHHTQDLFFASATDEDKRVAFSVSRLLVDVERFIDDSVEPMAKKGMGVVYEKTSEGKPLKKFSPEIREELLRKLYIPHHQKLTLAVDEELKRDDVSMIIDCHSFPSQPLPYEDEKTARPDICLGVDEFHTPPDLVKEMVWVLKKRGLGVAINSPFAGTMVPSKFYRKNNMVKSIMIEVNRALYMNEESCLVRPVYYEETRKLLGEVTEPARIKALIIR